MKSSTLKKWISSKRGTRSFSRSDHQSRRRRLRAELLEARLPLSATPIDDQGSGNDAQVAIELFATSPALFVENQGQWADESVRFLHQGNGANVAMTDSGPVFQLFREIESDAGEVEINGGEDDEPWTAEPQPAELETRQFSVGFVGANSVSPVGLEQAATSFNYYLGDETNWRSDVAGYEIVAYEGLYEGVDLHTWGQQSQLKYEFIVAPGADWTPIVVQYEGIEGLTVADDGSLIVGLGDDWASLVDAAPYVYQDINGERIEIESSYRLLDDLTFTFDLGAYDASHTLVIDPALDWATYLGGSGPDVGEAIAVDTDGNAFVTGSTHSTNFGGTTSSNHGRWDAFVAKVSSAGTLQWATYLGGSNWDFGNGIAVDGDGNTLVTGQTDSTNFAGANNSNHGGTDAFVAKVSSAGTLQWATYLGGSSGDLGNGIAVDGDGNALVTGRTNSTNFAGANNSNHGGTDAFVAKVSSAGTLQWATYLGGSSGEWGNGIAVDAAGNALVTGFTGSTNFAGAENSNHGDRDAFVAKVASGGTLQWATYLGGSGPDLGQSIAVDDAGNALVTGITGSNDFANANNSYHGFRDAFVAKVSPLGSLEWATYVGGSSQDQGLGIAVDSGGNALVTGTTNSNNFAGVSRPEGLAGDNAFVAKVSPSGTLDWATYLGGSGPDSGQSIAVDSSGNALVTGYTDSHNFAGVSRPSGLADYNNAFLTKIIVHRPIVELTTGDRAVDEGVGLITITAELDQPLAYELSVPIVVESITAVEGQDFEVLANAFTFLPGETTAAVTIAIIDDDDHEEDETFIVSLADGNTFRLGDVTQNTITILDNDPEPQVSFLRASQIAPTGIGTIAVDVRLNATSYKDVFVPLTFSGSATKGEHYSLPEGSTIVIPAGHRIGGTTIEIAGDTASNETKLMIVGMEPPTNASHSEAPVDPLQHVITIMEYDLPRIGFTAAQRRVSEGVGTALVEVRLSKASPLETSVLFAVGGTAGDDERVINHAQPYEIVIPAYELTGSISATIIDDDIVKPGPDETVVLTLYNPVNAVLDSMRSHTLSIEDNDVSIIQFTQTSQTVWEDVGEVTFTVTASNPSVEAITVPITISGRDLSRPPQQPPWFFAQSSVPNNDSGEHAKLGTDFTMTTSALVIPAGQTSVSRTVTIIDNKVNEPTKQIVIGLRNPSAGAKLGENSRHTIDIRDNNPLVSLHRSTESVIEADTDVYFEVRLSAPTNRDVFVPFRMFGTATAGVDFDVLPSSWVLSSSWVAIPAGQISQKVTVKIIDDLIDEPDETITMQLGSPRGGAILKGSLPFIPRPRTTLEKLYTPEPPPPPDTYTIKTITIIDNDGPPSVSWSTASRTVVEANRTLTYTMRLSQVSGKNIFVPIAFSGNATRNADYSISGLDSSDRLRFRPGERTASFQVQIIDDNEVEPTERIVMRMNKDATNVRLPKSSQRSRTITILDNDKPPAPTPRPGQLMLPPSSPSPGSYTGPGLDSARTSDINSLPPLGSLNIFGAAKGFIDGATAFFDANFNGVLDFLDLNGNGIQDPGEPSEPFARTQLDGSFAIAIPDKFDLDDDGFFSHNEGRWVLAGGFDSAISLPLRLRLTAVVGHYMITPLTTVVERLVTTHGLQPSDAETRVLQAFGLEGVNLGGSNPLQGTLRGDQNAAVTEAASVRLYSAVQQIADLFAGTPGAPPVDFLGELVFTTLAGMITQPGSSLDLGVDSVVATVIEGVRNNTGILLDPNPATHEAIVSGAARVIAYGNRAVDAIDNTVDLAYLTQLFQVKKVMLGQASPALREVTDGTRTIDSVLTDFTGDNLQTRIEQATVDMIVPPALLVNHAVVVEGDAGQSTLEMVVSLVGEHSQDVSVDFSTQDDTASSDAGDYVPVHGTLNWAPGDNTDRIIQIPINGNSTFEPDKNLVVVLSNPTAAVIRNAVGYGFILNDDPLEHISSAASEFGTNTTSLSFSDVEFLLTENETVVHEGSLALPTSITITGQNDLDNTLVLEFGTYVNTHTVDFHGGSGESDSIVIDDGTFASITHSWTEAKDGVTAFLPHEFTQPLTLNWFDVESFLMHVGGVDDLVLELPDGAFDAILDDADPADKKFPGMMRLYSASGAFEPIIFSNPNDSITVRGTSTGFLAIGNLDPAFQGVVNVIEEFVPVPPGEVWVSDGNLMVTMPNQESADMIIAIDSQTDELLIGSLTSLVAAGDGSFQDGPNVVRVPMGSVTGAMIVSGDLENHSLTLDFFGGNLVPSGGLTFTGGLSTLRLFGIGHENLVYTPDYLTYGSGDIEIVDRTITFSGVESVDFDNVGTFALTLPAGDDVIDIANGVLADGISEALTITGSSGGVPFAEARVRDSAIMIDTTQVDGDDMITIAGAGNGHGNTGLTIQTGDGNDMVLISGNTSFLGPVSIASPEITLNANVRTSGATEAGNLTLSGDVTITGPVTLITDGASADGNVLIDGALLLAGSVTVSSGQGDVAFLGTVDGPHSLSIESEGAITLNGVVGGQAALASLTTGAGGTTSVNDVTTSGIQSYGSSLVVSGGLTSHTSTVSIAGTTTLAGDTSIVTGLGDIAFSASVNSSGAGTVSDAHGLTLTTGGGNITFSDTVGDAVNGALGAILVYDARHVTFASPVRTRDDVTQISGSGTTTFNGTIGPGIGGTLHITTDAISLESAALTTVGPVSLQAQHAILFNANLHAGSSTISISANQGVIGTQGFFQADGTLIKTTNASNDAIRIVVGGASDAEIAALQTGVGGHATIKTGGAIVHTGDTHTDIVAGTLSLQAGGTGIGTSLNPINFSAEHLNASTTGDGNHFFAAIGSTIVDSPGLNAGAGTIAFSGGTFVLGGPNRISNSSSVHVADGVTLRLSGFDAAIGGLSGAGTIENDASNGWATLTVEQSTHTTFSGTLRDSGIAKPVGKLAVRKSGTGRLILSGTNTYSGDTVVTDGTLVINGSVTSDVTVTSFGTLHGSGVITGNVTGDGTFSPGDTSAGVMTIAGDFVPHGTVEFDVNSEWTIAGTHFDQYLISGLVDLSGATLIFNTDNDEATPTSSTLIKLIDRTGSSTTTASLSPADRTMVMLGSQTFWILYNGGTGNDVVLTTNTPPIADAGGPYTTPEGSVVQFDASATFDNEQDIASLVYEWDFNFDGSSFNVDATGMQPSVAFSDNFDKRTIAVRVIDFGGLSDIATSTLEVTNVAPTGNFGNDGLVTYGEAATVFFTNPFDPSSEDTEAGFRYAYALDPDALTTVTYANGSTDESTFRFAGLDAGTFTVYARIIDKDDGYTQYSTQIVVNPAPLTVTVDDQLKTYDGSEFTNFTLSYDGFLAGESAAVLGGSPTFSGPAVGAVNAGSYAIEASGLTSGNYDITFMPGTLTIDKANATIDVDGTTVVYDGTAHGANGTATGADGENLTELLDLGATFVDHPGGIANWSFPGDNNHLPAGGSVEIVINKAVATIDVDGTTVVYDGTAHGASGTATGAAGEDLTGLLDLGDSFIDHPGGTAIWTFAGDNNHLPASGAVKIVIDKAVAAIGVEGTTVVYDGNEHGASGTVTGAAGEDLTGLLDLGVSFIDHPGGTANWLFAGDNNHLPAKGSVEIVINKADAVIDVSGLTVTYDGNAHGASGTATGVNDEPLAGLDLSNSFTNVPGGTANWTFTDVTGNYNDASGSVEIVINKADAVIDVSGLTVTYDGNAHGAGGTATGVSDELLAGLDLGASFINVPGGTASWIFTDVTGNYNDASGSVEIVINKADAAIDVSGLTSTFDGNAQGASGTAVGVNDESLAGLDLGAGFTNVPGGTANWTFTDVTGNYNDASGSVEIVINKADAVIDVTGLIVTYDGNAHGAGGTATGINDEPLAGLDLGASLTNVPGGTANWTFTDVTGNYNDAGGSVEIVINQRLITVTAENQTKVYGDDDPPLTYKVTDGNLVATDNFFGELQRQAGEDVRSYTIEQGTLGLSDNYDLSFVEAHLAITHRLLIGDATTQDALNLAKQGRLNITVAGLDGFVNGENAEVFLSDASFWITIDDERYEFVPDSVTKLSDSSIAISYRLKNSDLQENEKLAEALEAATSGASALKAGFAMESNNYQLSDDSLTRLFSTTKR